MDRLEELMLKLKEFSDERDWNRFHTPSNLAKSISIEAAELLECFQWSDDEFDSDAVADVMNYCLRMTQVLGVDMIDIVSRKMDKNAKKYPVERSKGKSVKYNRL